MQSYSLDIVSMHQQFRNKPLRKYHVDGVDTVGVWGNEPFEIKFYNNTLEKVQVKVSVDGTDVLLGGLADTNPESKMWVVYGKSNLRLKAWAESVNGGSQFVFTHAEKSVALHTHGDMSSKGIISVAVFRESEPARFDIPFPMVDSYPRTCKGYNYSTITTCSCSNSISTKSYDLIAEDASVGAGSFVEQHISYVSGLVKPVLDTVVQVRYLWWDDLKSLLLESGYMYSEAIKPGFPGDRQKMIDLNNVPKINTSGSFRRVTVSNDSISRF